jgi:hypothetical protein
MHKGGLKKEGLAPEGMKKIDKWIKKEWMNEAKKERNWQRASELWNRRNN